MEKMKKASFIEKVLVIIFIITVVIMLCDDALKINENVKIVNFGILFITAFYLIPLRMYLSKNKDKQLSEFIKSVLFIQAVSSVTFGITLYRIFISSNTDLKSSYYFFIASTGFLLIMSFVFILWNYHEKNEEDKKKHRSSIILSCIQIILCTFVLYMNSTPFAYTMFSEDNLKELKISQHEHNAIYKIDQTSNERKKIRVDNSDLLDNIINQINFNEIKRVSGADALNCMKREEKFVHYEVVGFSDFLVAVEIYPDGYTVIRKLHFGESFFTKPYSKYYKINLSEEIIKKVSKIVENDQ